MSQIGINRGRIIKPLDPNIVRYINGPTVRKDFYEFREEMLKVNLAHILMLAHQGILTREITRILLQENIELLKETPMPNSQSEGQLEDLYTYLEYLLIERVGVDIGGQQHTARSRNDLGATLNRMMCRKAWLALSEHFIKLRETLLDLAKRTQDVVFSGYTHLQPSEPITFAHWCCALLFALERDYRDFSNAWCSINQNPLGACSMGSTTFRIDRVFTTQLLGFESPLDNSLDAVATRDYAVKFIFSLSECANTLSRLATDLYVWSTPQFGYVEIDDSCAVCSSIMPQKKNAFTLEHIKSKAAHLHGYLTGMLSCARATPYTHCKDMSVEMTKYLSDAVLEMEGILVLADTTLGSMKLNRDKMFNDAKANFSTVTELANALVRTDGVSFREAHSIVASIVRDLTDKGLNCLHIHEPIVQEIFKTVRSDCSKLNEAAIRESLDPAKIVMAKNALGGCSWEEIRRQILKLEKQIAIDKVEIQSRLNHLKQAEEALQASVSEILKN